MNNSIQECKKKQIDCLFIGHNSGEFETYVDNVKNMGVHSGAFRDLNLSFLRHQGRHFHATSLFNHLIKETHPHIPVVKDNESFSNTIAYLGSFLARAGFTFDFIHSFQTQKEQLATILKENNPLAVAITTTLYITAYPIREIVQFIRQYRSDVTIIIGGPYIATQVKVTDPETLQYQFQSLGGDIYVNSSQGETTLVRILEALAQQRSLDSIPSIYYKLDHGAEFNVTPTEKEDNPLEQNMIQWQLFRDRVGEFVNLRTSISCPFSCGFCGFPQHAGRYQTASVEAVQSELDALKELGTVKTLQFVDDTINVPVKRFKEMMRMMIRNRYPFKWYSQYRCQFADEETVALMKESGCVGVFLGIESGSPQILENMNKQATVEQYRQGIALLKQYEIITHGSFIIGFPGETRDTLKQTAEFIAETQLDFFRTLLWYCEPITPIWQQRGKYAIQGSHFEWRHQTMTASEATEYVDDFFFHPPGSLWLPQFGFDFDGLFHLYHRGFQWETIKNYIESFNEAVREKLDSDTDPEISETMMEQLRDSFILADQPFRDKYMMKPSKPSILQQPSFEQELDIDFDLD